MTATKHEARKGTRRHGSLRKVWITSLTALLVLAAPLVVSWQAGGLSTVHAEFKGDTNPRSNFWGAVRQESGGYSAVKGPETGVLIENGGQNWRQVRNGPVATVGAWLLGVVVAALILFHLIVGKARLEKRTGRKVLRWNVFERFVHWFVAILFIILAVTGLSLLYGRAVLIPVMGYEGFAAWAQLAKDAHNYLAMFFVVGLVVMLAMWFRENFLTKVDWEWFKSGGGYFGGKHPHAYKVNAGEKVWFWVLFIAGIGMMISGIVLLFPNLLFVRETMQLANIVHAATGVLLTGFSLGHIYLGTLGNEGSFEGMVTGEVDEAWAKQHHDLWYEETGGHGEAGKSAEGQPSAT